MRTSQAGLEFLAREEGEVLHVYDDQASKPTIGVGHLLRPGESFPNGITHEQAIAMLAADVRVAEASVDAGCPAANAGTLSQNAFDALVSFTFNCGGGALATSSLRRMLNAGDMQGAAKAFELWCRREPRDPATGELTVDQGLLARRRREAALFLTPDTPTSERETLPELPSS